MELERQKIIIDLDDTFLKSSEEIIRQLNNKNGTHKTIEDLKDYQYRSIDKNITSEEVVNMYTSKEFFNNVKFNNYAIEFLCKFSKIFDIIFISYGDKENIKLKEQFIDNLINTYHLNNIHFIGCLNIEGQYNKSRILLSNIYLAIDNHCEHLEEHNSQKKILFKNYQNVTWNQVPINSNWYCVDSFQEIEEMIDFDLKLKEAGIWLEK